MFQEDQTVYLERYLRQHIGAASVATDCDIYWEAHEGMARNYMALKQDMEHLYTPQDSLAVRATRYDRGLYTKLTRGQNRWRTTLWRLISSNNAAPMFAEAPGALVEPRRRYRNFYICPECTTCTTSAAWSKACQALYWRVGSFGHDKH